MASCAGTKTADIAMRGCTVRPCETCVPTKGVLLGGGARFSRVVLGEMGESVGPVRGDAGVSVLSGGISGFGELVPMMDGYSGVPWMGVGMAVRGLSDEAGWRRMPDASTVDPGSGDDDGDGSTAVGTYMGMAAVGTMDRMARAGSLWVSASRNARAKADASPKRAAGFFASARITTASKAGGTCCAAGCVRKGGGGS